MSLVTRIALPLWRAAFAAAIAVHLLALYFPQVPEGAQVDVPGADKVVHVLVFAAVMTTGLLARMPTGRLALVLATHAGASELIQHLVLPGREGDWLDVVANLGGVALGWYLATVMLRRRLTAAAPAPSASVRTGPPPSTPR